MPSSPIQVVFFDIDGTLVDHAAAARAGALGMFGRYRDRLTDCDERLLQRWRALEDLHFDRYLRGDTSYAGQRRGRVRGLFGLTPSEMPDAEADDAYAVYREFYERAWSLFPDAVETLDALGGCRLGVISNGGVPAPAPKARSGWHPGSLRGCRDFRGRRRCETRSASIQGSLPGCGCAAVGVPARGRSIGPGRDWSLRRGAQGRLD